MFASTHLPLRETFSHDVHSGMQFIRQNDDVLCVRAVAFWHVADIENEVF
jgi:hypothetical protein